MPEQTKINFRDNYGNITINNNGRPRKNPKESLGDPISIRLYKSEVDQIKEIMFESGMSRNEVIQKCIQIGLFSWAELDWIENNIDTIKTLAQRYDRKRFGSITQK